MVHPKEGEVLPGDLPLLQTFTELSVTLNVLSVYLWSQEGGSDLASVLPSLETLFKSEDGKFKLCVRHKQSKGRVAQVVIKDANQRLRIKPGLTQFAALDPKTLLLRFTVDSTHLTVSNLVAQPQRTSIYTGPETLSKVTCLKCQSSLSENGPWRVKSAPSASWQEVVGLWQCHDEQYDQFFDSVTKQLRVPPKTLLFNFNVLELYTGGGFADIFAGVKEEANNLLACRSCQTQVGHTRSERPLELSIASLVSTQRTEMESRAQRLDQSLIYSFFASEVSELDSLNGLGFIARVKTVIYNHCVEDRQKNLVFMAEGQAECSLVTIKPLSHIAYIAAGYKLDNSKSMPPVQLTEANKLLFSQMRYNLGEKDNSQTRGLIDFVKQISAVRHVTHDELACVIELLKQGQEQIPEAIRLVKKGLYQLTYIV